MIIYDNTGFFRLLFHLRGTVFRAVLVPCLFSGAMGALCAWLQQHDYIDTNGSYLDADAFRAFYTFLGTVLGLLQSFRLSFAYGRWAEAISTMGNLRHHARCIVSTACVFFEPQNTTEEPDEHTRTQIVDILRKVRNLTSALCILFVSDVQDRTDLADLADTGYLTQRHLNLLRAHERHLADSMDHASTDIKKLHEAFPPKHGPALLITLLRQEVKTAYRLDLVPEAILSHLQSRIDDLSQAFSWLGRISATPMPFIYAHFFKVVLFIYVLTVPFGIAGDLKWVTPAASIVVAFLFFGTDALAIEIEEPFGDDANDIDAAFHIYRLDKETIAILNAREAELGMPLSSCRLRADLSHTLVQRRTGTRHHRGSAQRNQPKSPPEHENQPLLRLDDDTPPV